MSQALLLVLPGAHALAVASQEPFGLRAQLGHLVAQRLGEGAQVRVDVGYSRWSDSPSVKQLRHGRKAVAYLTGRVED